MLVKNAKSKNRFRRLVFFLVTAILFIAAGKNSGQQEDISNVALEDFQRTVIAELTGFEDIEQGVTLFDRSSPENRRIVRKYLADLLNETGLTAQFDPYIEDGENVYAVLDATTPSDEYVILGAHFDTVKDSPGANDNASGIALVAAVAKRLVSLDYRSRNFIIVFFDEEETGLYGSRNFAQKIVQEEYEIHSVHTVDMVGWDSDGDGAVELEMPYEGVLELYESAAKEKGQSILVLTTKTKETDHTSFRKQGFKAVGISEEYRNHDTTPYYHTPEDTYTTVNFKYLLNTTILVTGVMEILAR